MKRRQRRGWAKRVTGRENWRVRRTRRPRRRGGVECELLEGQCQLAGCGRRGCVGAASRVEGVTERIAAVGR